MKGNDMDIPNHLMTKLASDFYDAFDSDTRKDGTEFFFLRDGSPEWMEEAVQAAHEGMMPDDTKYRMIRECLSQLSSEYLRPDEWQDCIGEIADGLVDVYNMDRVQWLASDLNRACYCDEAQDEGLVDEDATIFVRLGCGQYMEYREILNHLVLAIQDEAAEQINQDSDTSEE